MEQQQPLNELLDKSCSCKDTPETRAAHLDSLLALLIASSGQAWFQSWLDVKLASIYPKPSRTLLDAVLQAFIAASPLHCSYVLPSQLSIPGSTSLNAPLRRDIAVLFRPNQLLPSCWANQGVVCCSIVSFLATVAAEQLHQYQQPTPNSYSSPAAAAAAAAPAGIAPTAASDAAGRLGTVVGWLTDCLLQADPQHKLHFMQLAVATAVHRYTTLEHQQQQQPEQQEEAGIPAVHEEPPAKRRRLQEHCTEQTKPSASTEPPAASWPSSRQLPGQQADSPQGTAHSTPNSRSNSGSSCQKPSPQAILTGLQLLATICSCEAVQRNSHQLLAPAAVVAAETTAARPGSAAVSLDSPICTWLFKRLSSFVSSAATTAAGTANGSSSSAVSTPSVALAGQGLAAGASTVLLGQQQQRKQQQQQLGLAANTPAGLSPTAALQQVVQCMAAAGPQKPLHLACILMDVPLPATAVAAASAAAAAQSGVASASAAPIPQTAGGKQTNPTSMQHADRPAAAAAVPGSSAQAAACDMLFHRWLPEAAKQWRQTPAAAAGDGGAGRGRGRGRGGRGFYRAAAGKAPAALGLEQLLPEVPAVSASWVCKHMVPCLCQQASKEWQQQQQEVSTQEQGQHQPGQLLQSQQPSGGVACAVTLPAAAALVQLLAADGLLLPPSGEAPVAARALADALEGLPRGLQHHLAAAWEQQLVLAQSHQGSAAAADGAASKPEQQQPQEVSGVLLPWQTLQPMLCLVSNIPDPDASPVAGLLATALCSCLCTAAGRNVPSMRGPVAQSPPPTAVAAAAVAAACDVPAEDDIRKILRHLLLPLRFKLAVPARVWLLKQLLAGSPAGVHGRLSAGGPDGRKGGNHELDASFATDSIHKEGQVLPAGLVTAGLRILQELEVLLEHDCSAQLGHGLQLLAAGAGGAATASDGQQGKAPAVALQEGQARDFADAIVQLVTQLQRDTHELEGSAHMQVPVDQVVDLLTKPLQAADAAAYAQLKALVV